MRRLLILPPLALLLAACSQGEPIAPDAGPSLDAAPPDLTGEAPADAMADAMADAIVDAMPDVMLDVTTDAMPDAMPDTIPDPMPDAAPDIGPDAIADAAPDAMPEPGEPLPGCADLAARPGWTACLDAPDRCEGVFDDALGCAAWCARSGLRCAAVYENIDGQCAPDLARPALACAPGSGHHSDYCVCAPPDPRRPWEALAGQAIGYGRAATGGLGGGDCLVASLDDRGPNTLRDCAERPDPQWIRFAVSGTIALATPIAVQSDKTIDGRGADIRIVGRGLRLAGVRNVIVHNVRLDDGGGDDEDAIQLVDGTRHVWIDHVTLEDFTDGALDITRGATDVTVSWCHFRDHDKTMLIGASVDHVEDEAIRVTLHHNLFDGTVQRHPRLRYGRVHAFNNHYRRWGSYAIGASQRGQVRSQHNIFEAGDDPDAILTRVGDDPESGRVRSDRDSRLGGAQIAEREADSVFDPRADYAYALEDADDALRDRIAAGVGRRDVPAP